MCPVIPEQQQRADVINNKSQFDMMMFSYLLTEGNETSAVQHLLDNHLNNGTLLELYIGRHLGAFEAAYCVVITPRVSSKLTLQTKKRQ